MSGCIHSFSLTCNGWRCDKCGQHRDVGELHEEPHGQRMATMADALEAVLLFHSASPWTDAKRAMWKDITGADEATTRNLCDTVRRALKEGK